MSLRTLTYEGVEWTIWNVVPSLESRLATPLSPGTVAGWLCFRSDEEKRRIIPVPDGWEAWSDDELLRRLQSASVVAPHPPLPAAAVSGPEPTTDGERLRARAVESMRRARELGVRVHAMGRLPAPESGDPDR